MIGAQSIPTIRPLQPADHTALVEMTRSTAVFRPDEIEIADEVLRDANRDGPTGHYQVLVAELEGRRIGWSCHGRVPLTDATFDLYWIVVDPCVQGRGIGRQLLSEAERQTRAAGGRWLLAETSSTADYEATRNFYLRCGCEIVSQIDDFYRAGDGKMTFGKRLDQR
jgi:ribosomal protein S18 acetylase RimI-like enzyme